MLGSSADVRRCRLAGGRGSLGVKLGPFKSLLPGVLSTFCSSPVNERSFSVSATSQVVSVKQNFGHSSVK